MAVQKQVTQQRAADYYRKLRRQLAEQGTVMKVHTPSTENNTLDLKRKWIEHCNFLEVDPLEVLQQLPEEDTITFLTWILDNYRVKKRSTICQYFRQLRMLYRKSVGHSVEEINDYTDRELTLLYQLDLEVREKLVINVDNLRLFLHSLWITYIFIFLDFIQQLQTSLVLLFSAFTATRPGALVYVSKNVKEDQDTDLDKSKLEQEEIDEELVKTICYKDVTLIGLTRSN
ncbi:MAG: hypothetical protein M1818_000440 [Claussenomyces sp. TS43310]|nr:MAG: hypothetical protein M1818_000440 [Claussenomyces sp. TS43310]